MSTLAKMRAMRGELAGLTDEDLQPHLDNALEFLGDPSGYELYDQIAALVGAHYYELFRRAAVRKDATRGGLDLPGPTKSVTVQGGPRVEVFDLVSDIPVRHRFLAHTEPGALALSLLYAEPEQDPFPMIVTPTY